MHTFADWTVTMFVVLSPKAWQFTRTVRNEQGGHVRTLSFKPHEPQFLTGDDFLAVADDIGGSLLLCNVREDGKPLPLGVEEQERMLAKYRKHPPTKPPALIADPNGKPKAKKELEPATA